MAEMIFKTDCQKEREARDRAIYDGGQGSEQNDGHSAPHGQVQRSQHGDDLRYPETC